MSYRLVLIEQSPMGSGGLTCRGCAHWGVPGTAEPNQAECDRATQVGSPMYATAWDDAGLITQEDFACVEFKPKEQPDG